MMVHSPRPLPYKPAIRRVNALSLHEYQILCDAVHMAAQWKGSKDPSEFAEFDRQIATMKAVLKRLR